MLECLRPYRVFVTMQPQPAEPRGARGGHDVIVNSKGCARLRVTHVSAQAFMFVAGKTNEILLTIPALLHL